MQRSVLSPSALISAMVCVLNAPPAFATLTPAYPRGESIIELPAPAKRSEICVIPKHFDGAKYTKKDLETEQKLCGLNIYTSTAACPKLESTNPGVSFFEVPSGYTKEQVEQLNCVVRDPSGKDDNLAKKLAKYKLSVSCSYTPSILGYYHLSRILGDVGNVPVAVLRTMDLDTHKGMAAKALRLAQPKSGQEPPLIFQTWSGLQSNLDAGPQSRRKDQIFTDDFDQTYGALVKNPGGEEFYKEFFNSASGGQTRAQAYRDKNAIYQMLKSRDSIDRLVGRDFSAANVQKLVQLKDASEMILMDTIMNQQDRFGNIHYVESYYFRDPSAVDERGNPKIRSEKKLAADKVAQLGAVKVREMMLKDNDCGVSKTNMAKDAGLLDRVAHMDPKTYRRLQKLDAIADLDETKKFFKLGAMFTELDYRNIRANLKEAASQLKEACRSGQLKLDLDLEAHFGGRESQVSCDE